MQKEASSESVGTQIKVLRKRLGLSQTLLAQKVGVSKQAVSAYEAGTAKPSIITLQRLAEALETETDALLESVSGLKQSRRSSADSSATEEILITLPFITHPDFSLFTQQCASLQHESFPILRFLPVPGHDYQDAVVLEIRGNSMAPRYPERARFVMRPVAKEIWAHAQGVHVIVLSSQLFLLKRITSNQDGVLELSSDATGEKMKVTLTEVSCLWKLGEGVYYPAED